MENYIKKQSSNGKNIAGMRFAVLIFVTPSMFVPMAMMISEPTQDISLSIYTGSSDSTRSASTEIHP